MGVLHFIDLKRVIHTLFVVIALGLPLVEPPALFGGEQPGRDGGYKTIRNFSRKEYKNHSQNWSVVQDKRGIIYAANQCGVLEYDGVSWKEIPVTNNIARSLAMDDKGIIYVGGLNEIGWLAPDAAGALHYVSLVPRLEEKYRNFSYVWRILAAREGIYFWTSEFLILRNLKEIKIWKADSSFDAAFVCRGKLYVRQRDEGLLEMKRDTLERVPGGDRFSAENIYMLAPYDSQKLLVGTRTNGLFIYDGKSTIPFPTGADDYLKEKELYHGIRLSSGDFAMATRLGGLVVIDSHGNLEGIFDKTTGLQDDNIKYVFEDCQGNLWLALNEGISRIEYSSPFSVYDNRINLPGIVLSVTKHRNILYAGTTEGLYSLSAPLTFGPVNGISGNCWDIISAGDSLLAATGKGVFQLKDNNKQAVIPLHSFVLSRSRKDENRAWVGTSRGLVSLYRENRQWREERQYEKITQEIRTIVEDMKGNLWLGTLAKGVLKVDFPGEGAMMNPEVTRYDTLHGLPAGEVNVFWAAGHIMFATERGIFRFDETTKTFLPDVTLGKEFAGGENGKGVFRIMEDKNKNIWIHSEARNIKAIPQPDGTFVINKKPFLRIPMAQVNTIYPDLDGQTIWFAGVDELMRFDTRVKKNYDLAFQTLIRKVWVNGKPVFYGYTYKDDKNAGPGPLFPVIEYKDRSLRFEFAAPFYEGESETLYQCLLEGYDNDWTAWSKETWKDYTNVDPGLNTFRVRARNVYGNESREDSFQFRILPPWYNTWWAYSLYALAGLFMVFLVVKWRSWKLVREKQKLEQIINERTKEIKEKNQQLQDQSEKLKEIDKVKARFFANISHEFRTPLTLIMGPLEQMISDSEEKRQEHKLKMMLRNSQRLLGLINQLLELSKFDSGTMKLQCSRQNIVPFLKGVLHAFDSLAVQRELDLSFYTEAENIPLYFDPEKLEEVVSNLVSNAVKFTPAGGRITLTVKIGKALPDTKAGDFVEVFVSDTGPGIPGEQLSHIFDRFYQADSTYEHHRIGSGIGLAIAKEIVELHHGTITVHSSREEPSGTEFVVRLPMGKDHLKPDEIVEPGVPGVPADIKEAVPADVWEDVQADVPGVPVEAAPETGEKDTILVVEDSADVRSYIRGSLEPHYSVVEAKNGREGIEKAQEIIPDLIVSDIMMPDVDGYELCRVLKNDRMTSHIPIILLTAKASEESIIEGLETGADDYITKPFSTRILCARIKNLIDLRRHLQETLNREMTFQPAKISVSPIDKEFLHDLQAVIEENISDPDFNVEDLSKKLYMGRTTLYRKILALTGEPPTEFIRSYRLKQGAELLKKGKGSVLEVAFEVGFSSANYFTKCFKKKFHQLPTTFKETESGS